MTLGRAEGGDSHVGHRGLDQMLTEQFWENTFDDYDNCTSASHKMTAEQKPSYGRADRDVLGCIYATNVSLHSIHEEPALNQAQKQIANNDFFFLNSNGAVKNTNEP